MDKKNQQVLVVSAIVAVISIIVFGILITRKLERVVLVVERSEQKLDRMIQVASPVGHAAVEKGVKVMKSVDEEELAKSAEQGVKEVGAVAKGKLLEWVNSQRASPENRDIPNLDITIETKSNSSEETQE